MPAKLFSAHEIRVIGCLIEKSLTTPDQYPLSLNALQNACNQRSNREPVYDLDEGQVQAALDSLCAQGIVTAQSGFGSRVEKYKHRFCNTEFSDWKFSERELGVLCVLFLRGPQTPGELRTRTNRLCTFSRLEDVEATLESLAHSPQGPFVKKLAREPGKREARFAHLLSAESEFDESAGDLGGGNNEAAEPEGVSLESRVARLEALVVELQNKISELEAGAE